MSKEYTVSWSIQLNANTPREAAEKALEIQRDCFSSAVVFLVVDADGVVGDFIDLDLSEEEL